MCSTRPCQLWPRSRGTSGSRAGLGPGFSRWGDHLMAITAWGGGCQDAAEAAGTCLDERLTLNVANIILGREWAASRVCRVGQDATGSRGCEP
jgi:hypothetical protein